jgi:hypothetical protein
MGSFLRYRSSLFYYISTQQVRFKMKAGDLVALYKGKFKLTMAIDSMTVMIIYKNSQIEEEAINQLWNHVNLSAESFSEICYHSVVPIGNKFEIYKTNVFSAIKEHRKTFLEFFNSLKDNLKRMHTFEVGQILKMPGLKLIGMPLYNHHVIFSGNFSFT